MQYCARCLYPANHPLFITFDDEGVCSGCRVHEEKDRLDWTERFQRLERLVDSYRNPNADNYDCVVPVSGDGDSYYIVYVVKEKLGLNPLLVTHNRHYNTPVGIRNLARLRTVFDCDHVQQSIDPDLLKRITRLTLEKRASMYWHALAGGLTFPVRIAVRFRIPLIIWGAEQLLDQVGRTSHLDEVEMTHRARREHGLMNLETRELIGDGVSAADMAPFTYPDDEDLMRIGVRGIYLGNFIRWDSKSQHEKMIAEYGYEAAPQARTFNTYENVGCVHYSGLHDWIKFLKWGYGKATDHACREIRLRRMSREEGVDHVLRYQNLRPDDLDMFLDWMGMTETQLMAFVDRRRDPRIWSSDGQGGWSLLDNVANHRDGRAIENARLERTESSCAFATTPPRNGDGDQRDYIILARGWDDALDAAHGSLPR